jgi:hypothetical protein
VGTLDAFFWAGGFYVRSHRLGDDPGDKIKLISHADAVAKMGEKYAFVKGPHQ